MLHKRQVRNGIYRASGIIKKKKSQDGPFAYQSFHNSRIITRILSNFIKTRGVARGNDVQRSYNESDTFIVQLLGARYALHGFPYA